MTATYAVPQRYTFHYRLATFVIVVLMSLFCAALTLMFGEFGIVLISLVVLAGLSMWRPRYGLYAVLMVSIGLENMYDNPIMRYGSYVHASLGTYTPFDFLIVTPIELLVIIVTIIVVIQSIVHRTPLVILSPISVVVLLFLGLLTLSIIWGVLRNGDYNIALWETRAMYLGGLVTLLVPRVLNDRRQVAHIVNMLSVIILLLSVETVWRKFALINTGKLGIPKDLAFAHETPIFMNILIVLLVARLVWPATGRQRAVALLVPFIMYAQMLTERRAGWVTLDLGLVLIAIFTFRLRRKVFYYLVLPLGLIYIGYLAAFWNAQGAIAQPARAIRSINNPEGRDLESNMYRLIERANIRQNIRANPITGLGFGQQYIFYYSMPDLSWWVFWHYIPHNGVLFIWMKMGPIGFITFLSMICIGVVRGIHLMKSLENNHTTPLLVVFVSSIVMVFVFSYVDIGLNNVRVMILMGFALGVIAMWDDARVLPGEDL